jgi:hypothetical protein
MLEMLEVLKLSRLESTKVDTKMMMIKLISRNGLLTLGLLGALIGAAPASALTIEFGGADNPSLKGATGALSIVEQGDEYLVTWSMDFDGFVGNATHQYLTHVAFKAFEGTSDVELVGSPLGGFYASSNVRNGGCDTGGSPAGFVCLDLKEDVLATQGGSFSVSFLVDGTLADEVSYRGKFGTGNGWVISESRNVIPEPTAALLFAIGAVILGGARRSRA